MVEKIAKCLENVDFAKDQVLLSGHTPVHVIGYRPALCSDGGGIKPRWKRQDVEGKSEKEIRRAILDMVDYLSDYSLQPAANAFAEALENAQISATSALDYQDAFASPMELSAPISSDPDCGATPLIRVNKPTIFVFGLLFEKDYFVEPWLQGSARNGTPKLDPNCNDEVRVSKSKKHMLWYSHFDHDDKQNGKPGERWYEFPFRHTLNKGGITIFSGNADPGSGSGGFPYPP